MKEASKKPNEKTDQGGLARVVLCRDPDDDSFFQSAWTQSFYDFSRPVSVLSGYRRSARSSGSFKKDCYLLDE